jgi:hypothetical protein
MSSSKKTAQWTLLMFFFCLTAVPTNLLFVLISFTFSSLAFIFIFMKNFHSGLKVNAHRSGCVCIFAYLHSDTRLSTSDVANLYRIRVEGTSRSHLSIHATYITCSLNQTFIVFFLKTFVTENNNA